MMRLKDLSCGECYRCCTTNDLNRFRTPVLYSDKYLKHVDLSIEELSEKDIDDLYKVIPEYLKPHTDLKKHGCLECKWLRGDGNCSVYDKRPFICKQYPFQLVKLNGVIYLSVVTNNCKLGLDIFNEICAGNEEFIEYARSYMKESMEKMLSDEIDRMADYAESHYAGVSILNPKIIKYEVTI